MLRSGLPSGLDNVVFDSDKYAVEDGDDDDRVHLSLLLALLDLQLPVVPRFLAVLGDKKLFKVRVSLLFDLVLHFHQRVAGRIEEKGVVSLLGFFSRARFSFHRFDHNFFVLIAVQSLGYHARHRRRQEVQLRRSASYAHPGTHVSVVVEGGATRRLQREEKDRIQHLFHFQVGVDILVPFIRAKPFSEAQMLLSLFATAVLLIGRCCDGLSLGKSMSEVYDSLASRCVAGASEGPVWIGIAGGPGAGKSTVAQEVSTRVSQLGVDAVVLPMDGYHYSRAELCVLDPPDAPTLMPRRGAPETFDAAKFAEDLIAAKASGAASWPTYSRELSDPIQDAIQLDRHHRVVLVEGNYLFLGQDRWKPLLDVFDEKWFVSPRGGIDEQRERLILRHLETWTDAKTEAWGAADRREGATKRTDFNDVPNAHLVQKTRHHADLQIETF